MYSNPYVFWYKARRSPADDQVMVVTEDTDGQVSAHVSDHRWMWQAKLVAAWKNFRRPVSMKMKHLELKGQRRCR